MAKCPNVNCKTDWQWDWDMDHYRRKDSGEWAKMTTIFRENEDTDFEIRVDMWQCTCGLILAFQALDPMYGGPIFNHDEWRNINWEDEEHCYEERNLNKEG